MNPHLIFPSLTMDLKIDQKLKSLSGQKQHFIRHSVAKHTVLLKQNNDWINY